MTANPLERIKKNAMSDTFSTLSLFQPSTTQPRPAVELVQLPDDSLPMPAETDVENDCPACD